MTQIEQNVTAIETERHQRYEIREAGEVRNESADWVLRDLPGNALRRTAYRNDIFAGLGAEVIWE